MKELDYAIVYGDINKKKYGTSYGLRQKDVEIFAGLMPRLGRKFLCTIDFTFFEEPEIVKKSVGDYIKRTNKIEGFDSKKRPVKFLKGLEKLLENYY